MMAFITNKNKPKVKMVAGNVKIIKMGFTVILKKASTIAKNKALTKLVTVTPGKKFAITTTATAVKSILKIVFIIFIYNYEL